MVPVRYAAQVEISLSAPALAGYHDGCCPGPPHRTAALSRPHGAAAVRSADRRPAPLLIKEVMVTSLPRNVVLAALALALLPRSLPADPPAPGKDDIARAVRQLGDDSFAVREKASAFLWKAGRAAEPALEEAAKSDDIEVSRRARDLLEKFKHGIYPDTPADVLNLIGQYRAGDPNGKENAVKELLKLGRPGYQALLKLASSEEDAGARRQLTDLVCRETIQAAGALVAAGNYAAAEDLLEMSTAGSLGPSLRNYAESASIVLSSISKFA